MTLMKANESRLPGFSNSFSDMLDRFFDEAVKTGTHFVPSVDLKEDEHQYDIDVSVPGMKKDDINLELDGQTLHISGEKSHEEKSKDKTYHRVETEYGYFHRTFNLPDNANVDNIDAGYENGILKVKIPKDQQKSRSKKIDVQ